MKYYLAIPNFGVDSTPALIADSALLAEELGFDGIGVTDHILVPRGNPERYERIFEAFTTLAYLAAVTENISLITTVIVPVLRNPFVVAKQAATVDQLSNGRLILGLGVGWVQGEFENLHEEFRNRGKRFDEMLALFAHLFSGSPEPFVGDNYSYDDGVFDPLPAQGDRLPILLGGTSERAIRRAARVAHMWESTLTSAADWCGLAQLLHDEAAQNGRTVEAGARVNLVGGADEMHAEISQWQEVGAGHLMLTLGEAEGYRDRLRMLAEVVREFPTHKEPVPC